MEWDKRGIVWGPNGLAPWATHSAMQPTPYLFDDGPLRIYAGFRAADGRSSVGFVDVDPACPSRVLRVSETPALAPGTAGAFASDGVVPTAVVRDGDLLRLYYAGYLRRSRAPDAGSTRIEWQPPRPRAARERCGIAGWEQSFLTRCQQASRQGPSAARNATCFHIAEGERAPDSGA